MKRRRRRGDPGNFRANYTVWPLGWTSSHRERIIVCPRCGRRGAYAPPSPDVRFGTVTHSHPAILARPRWRDGICVLLDPVLIAAADLRRRESRRAA